MTEHAWMKRTAESLGIYNPDASLLELAGALTGWINDHREQPGMDKLRAERDEADRINGRMLRENERLQESERARRDWLWQAKIDAGYGDNVSFDVVWADALKALLAASPMSTELIRCVNACKGVWPEDLPSGVMFFNGERITQEAFTAAAKRLGVGP